MAIDRDAERVSAINQLVGLRVLFPTGTMDQDNRQASCRTCVSIYAITPIVILDCAIILEQAISAVISNEYAIDAPITNDPALGGTPGINE